MAETDRAHLGVSLPIAGLAGDQQAALFGQGCCADGHGEEHLRDRRVPAGVHRRSPARSRRTGLLATAACGPRGEPAYALEGSVFIAGAAIQWLRDGLRLHARRRASRRRSRASVPDTGGVHFVPAFVGLGTPHWEAEARGTITGITRGTTRAHLVRAALEAMAFSSADLLEAMTRTGGFEVPALRVDGGASANDWLMQFQADVLGVPVERPDMVETTALGAAGLAGIALGVWKGSDEFLAGRRFDRFVPTLGGRRAAGAAGGVGASRRGGPRVGARSAGRTPGMPSSAHRTGRR